ncbi:MAG: outer membrane protein assembly factor BamA [Gammaproteobacteria bacterium]
MKKIIIALIVVLNVFVAVTGAHAFVVQKIEVQGLQRISQETVYSYLPIKRGQNLGSEKTGAIIKALYKTGFFEHITLNRQGNTLVINVVERATIGKLEINGNSFIPTDKLNTVMKSMDIAEGRVYNRAMIDRIKQSLLNQYYELGRYNARVDVTATPMPRNRVLVKIDISEGLVAKIRRINIIGNHAFSESKLQKQLTVSTPGIFTFITQKDRYTQEKLEQSIENLRNYYLDHGYLKFAVKSSQVGITPDRKSIYLTIVIEEGQPYTVSGIEYSGNLILPRAEIEKRMNIHVGDTFSRQKIIDGEKAVTEALGDKGYIFATMSIDPRLNENNRTVFLKFEAKPGKRTYVRHIYFVDNTKTNDEALRSRMLQMESAVVSSGKLETSKHQLSMLPYIKDVQMNVVPVQGEADQVDVNYKVTEDNAAQANFTIGYSQQYGPQFGAGLNQKNFLGTGKTLGFNLTRSKYEQFYGINYTNPYYTPDGISRSINVSATKTNPGQGNFSSSYVLNQYNASVLYDIPIGQEKGAFDRIQVGYGYEDAVVHLQTPISTQVLNFVNSNGRHFGQVDLVAGISRDSRDKSIFPTRGTLNTLGINYYAPGAVGSLNYFTTAYSGKFYYPITNNFIFTAKAQVGYGNSFKGVKNFPFFKNFYAGGIDSVRGYLGGTLGPRDSLHKPTGGNLLTTGSLAMIFPNYLSENFRTSVFFDGGNVYNTFDNRSMGGTASGNLRYSTGVEGDWLTMFGLIDVSLAKPLNRKSGRARGLNDDEEVFQFSLGANFG